MSTPAPATRPDNVVKPHAIRDLGPVDTTILLEAAARFTERFWERENQRKENAYAVFHHTDHVVLRFVRDPDDLRTWYDLPAWAILGPRVTPALMELVEPYGLARPQLSKAMFARLAPHAVIDRHIDAARGNSVSHKIHIPLVTSAGALFQIGDKRFHLAAGRAYEVNNIRPHGAVNRADTARRHFIFEVFDEPA